MVVTVQRAGIHGQAPTLDPRQLFQAILHPDGALCNAAELDDNEWERPLTAARLMGFLQWMLARAIETLEADPQPIPSDDVAQRAAFDARWWEILDTIEATHADLDPEDADLPLGLVADLDELIHRAGADHAAELIEIGRDLALGYVVEQIGVYELLNLQAQTGKRDGDLAPCADPCTV